MSLKNTSRPQPLLASDAEKHRQAGWEGSAGRR